MNSNFSFGASQFTSTPRRSEDQGSYIDDYSHLRLSYYHGYQEHQGNQESSNKLRDGDDNSLDLRALYDDLYISSRSEYGLEGSANEVSQDAAIDDDEHCGANIISLLSSSPTYSSFEFIEHLHDSESILVSPEISVISDSRLLERTEDPRAFLRPVHRETNEHLPAQNWTEETKELIPPVHEEAWRTKLRNSYLASNVILPHPSQVAAAMIATASRKSGGHQFQYNDRVEPGSKVMMERVCDDSIVFDPKRRSTLKYNYFRF